MQILQIQLRPTIQVQLIPMTQIRIQCRTTLNNKTPPLLITQVILQIKIQVCLRFLLQPKVLQSKVLV